MSLTLCESHPIVVGFLSAVFSGVAIARAENLGRRVREGSAREKENASVEAAAKSVSTV